MSGVARGREPRDVPERVIRGRGAPEREHRRTLPERHAVATGAKGPRRRGRGRRAQSLEAGRDEDSHLVEPAGEGEIARAAARSSERRRRWRAPRRRTRRGRARTDRRRAPASAPPRRAVQSTSGASTSTTRSPSPIADERTLRRPHATARRPQHQADALVAPRGSRAIELRHAPSQRPGEEGRLLLLMLSNRRGQTHARHISERAFDPMVRRRGDRPRGIRPPQSRARELVVARNAYGRGLSDVTGPHGIGPLPERRHRTEREDRDTTHGGAPPMGTPASTVKEGGGPSGSRNASGDGSEGDTDSRSRSTWSPVVSFS